MDNNINEYDNNDRMDQGGNQHDQGGSNGQGNGGRDPRRQNIIMLIIVALLSLFIVSALMNLFTGKSTEEITYTEFIDMLSQGKVESAEIDSDRVYITLKDTESNIANENFALFYPAQYALISVR